MLMKYNQAIPNWFYAGWLDYDKVLIANTDYGAIKSLKSLKDC